MILTPPMVFSQTDGKVLVLLDHTPTRGPSAARMWDFCLTLLEILGATEAKSWFVRNNQPSAEAFPPLRLV